VQFDEIGHAIGGIGSRQRSRRARHASAQRRIAHNFIESGSHLLG